MFKKNCFFILLLFFSPTWGGEKPSEKSGYRYIIENYFSKRTASSHYTRSFSVYSGLSFYRESSVKSLPPFSSFVFGFHQKVKEIKEFGDINIKFSFSSQQLDKQNAFLWEFMPQLSFPDLRSAFPLYLGLGAGFGLYPRNIIRKKPSLSLSSEFFVGLRFLNLYHNFGLSSEISLRMQIPFQEWEIYLESLARLALVFCF